MVKQKYTAHIFLLVFFVLMRMIISMTSLDLFDYENLEPAILAEGLNDDGLFYITDGFIKTHSHQAGIVINAAGISLFYELFGKNRAAVELYWLFFSLGSFFLFSLILRTYFNYRVFIIASIFYILPPPIFSWYDLVPMIIQNLALFLTLLITFLNFKMLSFREDKIWHYLFYGFIAGVGISITHYCLIILFVSLLYQLWLNWRFFFKKGFFLMLLSFFIGLFPWIYINKCYHLQYFSYVLHAPQKLSGIWRKFIEFIIYEFPQSLSFKDFSFIKGITISYSYYFLCIVLFLFVLFFSKKVSFLELKRYLKDYKNRGVFICLFVGVFVFIYIFSGFKIRGTLKRDYRWFMVLYPFIFISSAIFIDKLMNKGTRLKILGKIIFILFCIQGLLGNFSMAEITNYNFNKASIYKSYPVSFLAYRIYEYFKDDKMALMSCIRTIQKNNKLNRFDIYRKFNGGFISDPISFFSTCRGIGQYQHFFYEGVGIGGGRFFRYEPIFQIELIKRLPPKYRLNEEGLLNTDVIFSFSRNPNYLEKLAEKLTTESKNFYYERVGLSMGILLTKQFEQFLDMLSKVDEKFRASLIKGYGLGVSMDNSNIESMIEKSRKIDEKYRNNFFEGIGFGFGLQMVPDIERIKWLSNKIDGKNKRYYYRGVGTAVGWYFISDRTLILKLAAARLGDFDFKIREYTFLTVGLYRCIDRAYKRAYCKGLGYGIGHYLFGYTAVVLSKLEDDIISQDYCSLLKGVCCYYYEKADGIHSCAKVYVERFQPHDKLANKISKIFLNIYSDGEKG